MLLLCLFLRVPSLLGSPHLTPARALRQPTVRRDASVSFPCESAFFFSFRFLPFQPPRSVAALLAGDSSSASPRSLSRTFLSSLSQRPGTTHSVFLISSVLPRLSHDGIELEELEPRRLAFGHLSAWDPLLASGPNSLVPPRFLSALPPHTPSFSPFFLFFYPWMLVSRNRGTSLSALLFGTLVLYSHEERSSLLDRARRRVHRRAHRLKRSERSKSYSHSWVSCGERDSSVYVS